MHLHFYLSKLTDVFASKYSYSTKSVHHAELNISENIYILYDCIKELMH